MVEEEKSYPEVEVLRFQAHLQLDVLKVVVLVVVVVVVVVSEQLEQEKLMVMVLFSFQLKVRRQVQETLLLDVFAFAVVVEQAALPVTVRLVRPSILNVCCVALFF